MTTDDTSFSAPACRIAVIGSGGRLGRMLRQFWTGRTDLAPRWTARSRSADVVDPLTMSTDALTAALVGSDIILNLAGPTPRPGQDSDPAVMAAHSGLATALLAAAVAPVVLLSSAAVYGDTPGLLSETTPPAPQSTYGHAKLAMEKIAADWPGPTRATVLRLGNVAGADMLLGASVLRDGPVRLHVFPDGTTPLRSTIGPATLARLLAEILLALHRGAPMPGLMNLAAPGAVAMGDLLNAAGLPWEPVPAPPGTIAQVTLATARLQRLVGFCADESTATGIVRQWRDYQRDSARGTP